ncbi:MAG: hypothetical protein ACTSP9_07535 [Promethearchaeota archaeon]
MNQAHIKPYDTTSKKDTRPITNIMVLAIRKCTNSDLWANRIPLNFIPEFGSNASSGSCFSCLYQVYVPSVVPRIIELPCTASTVDD